MNKPIRLKSVHLLIGSVLISGCTTPDKQVDSLPFKKNALIVVYSDTGRPIQDALEPLCVATEKRDSANRSRLGIAIVAGLGFNYAYEDPRASDAVLYMSRKYAESLQEEIKRCGVAVDVHMNTSKTTRISDHLSQSLAKRKTDGLIQVSIKPKQVGNGTELFISIDYFTLKWQSGAKGEMVTTGLGPSQSYQVAPEAPLALYARKFATVLHDKGYIGH